MSWEPLQSLKTCVQRSITFAWPTSSTNPNSNPTLDPSPSITRRATMPDVSSSASKDKESSLPSKPKPAHNRQTRIRRNSSDCTALPSTITEHSAAASEKKRRGSLEKGSPASSDGENERDPPPPYPGRSGSSSPASSPRHTARKAAAAKKGDDDGFIFLTTRRANTFDSAWARETAAKRREKRDENWYPGMEERDRDDFEGLTRAEIRDRGYYG